MAKRLRKTELDESEISTESETTEAETPEEKKAQAKVEKKLALARRQFKTCLDATSSWREEAQDDTRFRIGTWRKRSFQWPSEIQDQRRGEQRPCFTINRMPGFIRQVTNTQRKANLRIRVRPVDDKGDPKVAEVLGGIMRNIETQSFADRAYTTGGDKQCEIGLGYFELATEFADEKSFRKRIRIKRKRNPLAIYVDPSVEEFDFSDARYAFEVTDLDALEYEEETGKKPPASPQLSAYEGGGDQTGDWFPNGKIRVVRWFNREATGPKKHLAELSNGDVIAYPTPAQLKRMEVALPGVTVKQDRWVTPTAMIVRKIDALTIHEESVWPGEAIAFIPVIGEEYLVNGELDYRGVVRDAKDAGQNYNVQVTTLFELVGQGLKAPAVGPRGTFGAPDSPMRKSWENANKRPISHLEYEVIDIDGKPAAAPQRMSFSPDISGVIMAVKQADEDYKSLGGFHDASLGRRGPQESGVAIKERQEQDELGSSHYLHNLRASIAAAGKQLIKLIRAVYDVPTVVRITGADNQEKTVMVFSGEDKDPRLPKYNAPGQDYQLPEGVKEIFNIGVGEFDIEVSASQDDGTRRQEDSAFMETIMGAMAPEVAVNFLDLFFLVRDTPIARQLSARAKKMIDPKFQDDQEGGDAQMSPQAQAQVQQLTQQVQEAMAMVEQLQQEIAIDKAKLDAQVLMKREEAALKERLCATENRYNIVMEGIKLKGEKAMAIVEDELARMNREDEQQHELRLAHLQHAEKLDDHKREVRMKAIDAALAPKEEPGAKAKPKAKAKK